MKNREIWFVRSFIVDLVNSVRSGMLLKQFIERDLKSLLIEMDMSAAASALASAGEARDKKQVYWSVINHLESAESKSAGLTRSAQYLEAARTLLYINAMKAILYKYLDEAALVRQCYLRSKEIVYIHNQESEKRFNGVTGVIEGWNPINWVRLVQNLNSSFAKKTKTFDRVAFWTEMGFDAEELKMVYWNPDPGPNETANTSD